MTVAEAAAFLSVSTKTVRRLIARGALGYVKIGRSIRLRREVIERYISGEDGALRFEAKFNRTEQSRSRE